MRYGQSALMPNSGKRSQPTSHNLHYIKWPQPPLSGS